MAESNDPDSLPTQPWTGPPPAIGRNAAAPRPSPGPSPRAGIWQPPTPEEVQPSFPLHEIRCLLGRGGMGAVYQGWQKSLDRFVAIKILPLQIEDNDGSFAGRFKREAKAMARFSHPGIVSVYDAGETPEGLLYFVMEYVQGTDLQKTVAAKGALPAEQALAISSQICDALAYAHERGVVHRDIKPSNIMIDVAGRVKVADFGIAKVNDDETASLVTGTHVRMGTPDFMAPEALHRIGLIDHRADLYAVGVMLYQMLTGEVPRGRFDLPSVRHPDIDPRFDAIVDRAMQKDPDKRYASAVEIRSDLERIAWDRAHGSTVPRVQPDGSASIGSVSTKTEFPRWTESKWLQRMKHWLERLDHWSLAKTAIFFGFNVGLAVLIHSEDRAQPMQKVFLGFLIFVTSLAHLRILLPRTFERNSRILLVFGVILLHLAIVRMFWAAAENEAFRGASHLHGAFSALEREQLWRLAVPYTFAPLILSVLLGKSHGIYAATFVSLWGALVNRGIDPVFLVMSLISGTIAVLMALDGRGRIRLVRAGFFVGLVTWLQALIFGLIGPIIWESLGVAPWLMLGWQSVAAVGSGIASGIIVGGALPIFESMFGITTSLPPTSPQNRTPQD